MLEDNDELSQVVEDYTGGDDSDVAPETEATPEAEPTSAVETDDAAPPDKPLSRAELEAALQARDAEWQKRLQSSVDKAESRVQKRFAQVQADNARALEILKLNGIPQEQIDQYAQRLESQAMRKALSEEQGGKTDSDLNTATDTKQPQRVDVSAVNARAQAILKESGVSFVKDDPETTMIVTDGSPEEYIGSLKAAIRAKAARLKNKPSKPAASPAVGQVGGGMATKDLSSKSTRELMGMAIQQNKK